MDEQTRALYQQLLGELYRRMEKDPEIRRALKRIEEGKATFRDTALWSDRSAELLGEVFSGSIADMPAEARESLCKALLRERYDSTFDLCGEVQEALDERLGISLKPVKPKFPAERVQQIAHSLLDTTVAAATIERRAGAPVATVAKSFHDDYIRENASARTDLGFKCYLDRIAAPGCCPWCTDIAGRYVYGDHPDDIFHRHDNCACTVTFENGRERQDVWSKRTWDARDPEEVERLANEPVVNSQERAREIEENVVSGLTLAGKRSIIKAITIDDIVSAGIIDKDHPSAIKDDVAKAIFDTISAAKNEGGKFTFDEVRTVSLPKKEGEGIIVFQTNAVDRYGYPHVILEINILAVGDLDVEGVDALFSQARNTKCNSLADGIIHEIGHAKTIYGRNFANYERISDELSTVHIDGISKIAKKDGLELIAESEVMLAHGEILPKEVMDIYKKYTTGGG